MDCECSIIYEAQIPYAGAQLVLQIVVAIPDANEFLVHPKWLYHWLQYSCLSTDFLKLQMFLNQSTYFLHPSDTLPPDTQRRFAYPLQHRLHKLLKFFRKSDQISRLLQSHRLHSDFLMRLSSKSSNVSYGLDNAVPQSTCDQIPLKVHLAQTDHQYRLPRFLVWWALLHPSLYLSI